MIDVTSIADGFNLAKGVYGALEFIKKNAGSDIISAYFRYDGTRVEGDSNIEIQLHPNEKNPAEWFYSVKTVADYVFVRTPVIESCAHELVGTLEGELQPNALYWRWIAPVLPGLIYVRTGENYPPNLKVDFLVFGYKPKALIKYFSSK